MVKPLATSIRLWVQTLVLPKVWKIKYLLNYFNKHLLKMQMSMGQFANAVSSTSCPYSVMNSSHPFLSTSWLRISNLEDEHCWVMLYCCDFILSCDSGELIRQHGALPWRMERGVHRADFWWPTWGLDHSGWGKNLDSECEPQIPLFHNFGTSRLQGLPPSSKQRSRVA